MEHRPGLRPSAWRKVALTVVTTVTAGAGLVATAAPASAATPVAAERVSGGVTADALPTAQIDGVAWTQAVAGDVVYVGGKFTTARPAGAAPGTTTVPRSNFLAYTLSTGVLRSFAPQFDNQVYAVAVSPDRSTLYVGGQFTKVTVGGVTSNRYRVAAFDLSTGALKTTFTPLLNYVVKSIVATNSTVYLGGAFATVGSTARSRVAAVSASTGALLPWNPNADGQVSAMVLTPDGSKVVLGGNFQNVGGAAAYGITAVSATGTGARVPWYTDRQVRDAGSASSITSLSTDGTSIYGSGYVYGAGGNLEGAFRVRASDGTVTWVEDCHGDTYGVYADAAAVYKVGHAHYCGNVGGWPQTNPSTYQHALAFTKAATGTVATNPIGGYANWAGTPAPSITSWFPDLAIGSYTGVSQAAWSVTGNGTYVVLGGEFPSVNGVAQQGLVRFAVPSVAPRKSGPVLSGGYVAPTLSASGNQVTVSFPTNWDRDNRVLTYAIYRDGQQIATMTGSSTFWDRPTLTYVDRSVSSGTHGYRVFGTDADGNQVRSDGRNVTVA